MLVLKQGRVHICNVETGLHGNRIENAAETVTIQEVPVFRTACAHRGRIVVLAWGVVLLLVFFPRTGFAFRPVQKDNATQFQGRLPTVLPQVNLKSRYALVQMAADGSVILGEAVLFQEISDAGFRSLLKVRDAAGTYRYRVLTIGSLAGPDDQYLVSPDLPEGRKLIGSERAASIRGMAWSFFDLSDEPEAFRIRPLGRGEYLGRACIRLESQPVDRSTIAASGYSRRIIWMDIDSRIVWKIEYFGINGAPLKTMRFSDHAELVPGEPRTTRPNLIEITHHQRGTSESYRMVEAQVLDQFPPDLFSRETIVLVGDAGS
ncbi:MAG: outer membrane lipoprotein-sorting protein [Opitutales bacterium]